jgi:hypothetical protein
MFPIYFELGIDHILDKNAYDHVLFIIALCIIYVPKEWKNVLILVTAFTIGHSLTLALAAFDIIFIKASLVEFLIPLTILITAIVNIINTRPTHQKHSLQYLIALFFGFIHGLGFSNFFKALLGKEESVVGPLFAFNIGVEAGQILMVIIIIIITYMMVELLKLKRVYWVRIVSGVIAFLAIRLMLQ